MGIGIILSTTPVLQANKYSQGDPPLNNEIGRYLLEFYVPSAGQNVLPMSSNSTFKREVDNTMALKRSW